MFKVSSSTFVGEGKFMKRYLLIFLFLTSICYAETNQRRPTYQSLQIQVENLTKENQRLKQQMGGFDWLVAKGALETLKEQVEALRAENQQLKHQMAWLTDKEKEIERLKTLCRKNGIDPEEKADSRVKDVNSSVVRRSQFSFRGAYIGDPKSKMDKQLAVSPLVKRKNGLESFTDTSVMQEKGGSMKAYLGDIPIDFLTWDYLDDKLVGFSVVAKSNVFDQFRDYLIERYGQPSSIITGTTQNRMGATFPRVILTWDTSDGPMVLENPSTNIDEIALGMTQTGLYEELDRRDKEIAKHNADKAF
jgi:cell division protein FtsB